MVTIKIEIGFDRFDKEHEEEKSVSGIKAAALLAAFADSAVWILDTALLLKLFHALPVYPFGMFFIISAFFVYLAYLLIKTHVLIRKYGREKYKEEFGYMGLLLAAVSAILIILPAVTRL